MNNQPEIKILSLVECRFIGHVFVPRVVTPQVSDSSPPAAARVFFAAGLAACGCQARSKKLLRTTEGGEES